MDTLNPLGNFNPLAFLGLDSVGAGGAGKAGGAEGADPLSSLLGLFGGGPSAQQGAQDQSQVCSCGGNCESGACSRGCSCCQKNQDLGF